MTVLWQTAEVSELSTMFKIAENIAEEICLKFDIDRVTIECVDIWNRALLNATFTTTSTVDRTVCVASSDMAKAFSDFSKQKVQVVTFCIDNDNLVLTGTTTNGQLTTTRTWLVKIIDTTKEIEFLAIDLSYKNNYVVPMCSLVRDYGNSEHIEFPTIEKTGDCLSVDGKTVQCFMATTDDSATKIRVHGKDITMFKELTTATVSLDDDKPLKVSWPVGVSGNVTCYVCRA